MSIKKRLEAAAWLMDQFDRSGGWRDVEAVAPWALGLAALGAALIWMANGGPHQ